jgi:hypothetical protein
MRVVLNVGKITLERDYIVAGVRGHDPIVKVRQSPSIRLYAI